MLLMATPESKPIWFVRKGNRMFVVQLLIATRLLLEDVSANRGRGAEAEAVETVLIGAKLRLTVGVPKPGRLDDVLAT